MKELLFFASVNGRGGYERHAREVLRELYKTGWKIQLIDLPFHTTPIEKDLEIAKILEECRSVTVSHNAPVLIIAVPNYVRILPGRMIYNWTTFEADKIPLSWIEKTKIADMTIVTNNFLKMSWIRSGAEADKITVIGEGVNTQFFNLAVEPMEIMWRGKNINEMFEHRILVTTEISNRKNIGAAIEAFRLAFEGRKDVCLILKIGSLYRKEIYSYLKHFDFSRVYVFIVEKELSEIEYPKLLQSCTHYFTMSHGEGWDLNCVESGAMKKIVIAPYHTAYLDYLNDDRAWLIKKCIPVPAEQDGTLSQLFEGARWFEPSMEETVELLRETVKNTKENVRKVNNFYEYILNNLQWCHQIKKLTKIIE